jgi:hypothetical protein
MVNDKSKSRRRRPTKQGVHSALARLDELISEAVVDCYNASEELTGIYTMLEENLGLPFTTKVLGVEVKVERIDMNDADEIVAICTHGRERQSIPVIDLPLPDPQPEGAEWIEAYRRWAKLSGRG